MAEREHQPQSHWPLTLVHQLVRDVVDRRDVVGVDRVAEAEAVDEERGSEQHGIMAERENCPSSGGDVDGEQQGVDADDATSDNARSVVAEDPEEMPHRPGSTALLLLP